MTDAVRKRLLDARLACRSIEEFTAGVNSAAYEDGLVQCKSVML
jgi:hypothetical protein